MKLMVTPLHCSTVAHSLCTGMLWLIETRIKRELLLRTTSMMGLTVFLFYPLEEQTPETSASCSSNGGDLTLVVPKFSCFTFLSTPHHGFLRDFIHASCVSVRLSSFPFRSVIYEVPKFPHCILFLNTVAFYRKGPNGKEANTWLFTIMEMNLREQSQP